MTSSNPSDESHWLFSPFVFGSSSSTFRGFIGGRVWSKLNRPWRKRKRWPSKRLCCKGRNHEVSHPFSHSHYEPMGRFVYLYTYMKYLPIHEKTILKKIPTKIILGKLYVPFVPWDPYMGYEKMSNSMSCFSRKAPYGALMTCKFSDVILPDFKKNSGSISRENNPLTWTNYSKLQ